MLLLRIVPLVLSLGLVGCYEGPDPAGGSGGDGDGDGDGDADGDGDGDGDGDTGMPDSPPPESAARSGLRRLTAAEYDASIRDLLQETPPTADVLLPSDARTPFDNDYTTQSPSPALIEGAELLASDAIERLFAEPDRKTRVVGCEPTGPQDEDCMASFIRHFGRLALRRPLSDADVDLFVHGPTGADGALDHAADAGEFDAGVEFFLRTVLQDVEFLYRVEIGTPVDGSAGLHALDDYEVASRLSFLLWGAGPDDALLDVAEAGSLGEGAGLWDQAQRMLQDPRARERAERFHALWLSFEQLPHEAELSADMRAETAALLERVLFEEERPWQDIFRSEETFLTERLAENYGLPSPPPGGEAWTPYATEARRGILAHGSFLSNGIKFGDTSPVQRGLLVRTRLFCQDIPPPPPGVDVDEPPASDALCKWDVYANHRTGGCASCHNLIDPIGFGLEGFDAAGRMRTHQPDYDRTPDDESVCAIEAQGEILDVGSFSGPAELSELGLSSGLISPCMVTQLYRYTVGRFALDPTDTEVVGALHQRLGGGDFRFEDLIREIVSSPAFRHRLEEEV